MRVRLLYKYSFRPRQADGTDRMRFRILRESVVPALLLLR